MFFVQKGHPGSAWGDFARRDAWSGRRAKNSCYEISPLQVTRAAFLGQAPSHMTLPRCAIRCKQFRGAPACHLIGYNAQLQYSGFAQHKPNFTNGTGQ